MTLTIAQKVADLPLRPGVYQFFNAAGNLLYIGKATHLRTRVQSYFRVSTNLSDAKKLMAAQIADVQWIMVDTETEALLLETTLIKRHKPPFNVVMKDDKDFQYIHITNNPYPQIETTRSLIVRQSDGRVHKRSGLFFGPYLSSRSVRRVLHLLQEIFHICSSLPVMKHGKMVYPKRPCLEYHLGRCAGPCAGPCAGVVTPKEYQSIIMMIVRFLRGEYAPIERMVRKNMQCVAQKKQFERAAIMRDQLQAIAHLAMEQKVVSPRRENADYLSLARTKEAAGVHVFCVRFGKVIGREIFLLKHTEHQTEEEIFTAFMDQYYAQTVAKPARIYCSSEKHRGKIKKLLALGKENVEHALINMMATRVHRATRARAGLKELGNAIGVDHATLHRIEIYDISNVQGTYSVGSMVVFIDGEPEPSLYRKFKIKTVRGANDFASLQEVLSRRLRRITKKDSAWPRPDLLIIDGGKGQLRSATTVFKHYQLRIPVIALAKKQEEIFLPDQSPSIRLPRDSQGLFLLQRMRDEAHRFAIGFYRRRHLKGLLEK